MDDFYDTDVGVQTSDILVLPSTFLGTLWSELQDIGSEKLEEFYSIVDILLEIAYLLIM